MKKQNEPIIGPIEHNFVPGKRLDESNITLLPILGRRDLTFIAKGFGDYEQLWQGSIDADDVSVVLGVGMHRNFGPACHIDTKQGKSYLVVGTREEVEEALFGERPCQK